MREPRTLFRSSRFVALRAALDKARKPPIPERIASVDGTVRMAKYGVKELPAESPEQLIPPGAPITKAALAKARADFKRGKR